MQMPNPFIISLVMCHYPLLPSPTSEQWTLSLPLQMLALFLTTSSPIHYSYFVALAVFPFTRGWVHCFKNCKWLEREQNWPGNSFGGFVGLLRGEVVYDWIYTGLLRIYPLFQLITLFFSPLYSSPPTFHIRKHSFYNLFEVSPV